MKRKIPPTETVLSSKVEVYYAGILVGRGWICTRPNGEMHIAELFDAENKILPPDMYFLQYVNEKPQLWVAARRVQ